MYRRIGAIVQARMGSTRLPGKVLKPFAGESILGIVLQKLLMWSEKQDSRFVTVATTVQPIDSAICDKARDYQIAVTRGDENNVLARIASAARNGRYDVVIRVTADNPFLDISLLDKVLGVFDLRNADYAFVRGAPIGVGAEVIRATALFDAEAFASTPYELEHVTPYIRESGLFRTCFHYEIPDLSHYNLSVDTLEQFNRADQIASAMSRDLIQSRYHDVLRCIQRNRLEFPEERRIERIGGI